MTGWCDTCNARSEWTVAPEGLWVCRGCVSTRHTAPMSALEEFLGVEAYAVDAAGRRLPPRVELNRPAADDEPRRQVRMADEAIREDTNG